MLVKKRKADNLKFKVVLFGLHIILPFAIYFAQSRGSTFGAWVFAMLFAASMGVLVWLK